MKTYDVEQRSEAWHKLRKGKVTGQGLKKIIGSPVTRQSYLIELLADRISEEYGPRENSLERGLRLEPEAMEKFKQAFRKKVALVGFCEHKHNPYMGVSPDGLIKVRGKYREAVEIKCPTSATFVQAWMENRIPKDYYPQVIQYFIVNDDLEKLYFVLYDDRIKVHPLHVIEVYREDIQEDIQEYKNKEELFLNEVENKLSELLT